MIEVLSGMRLVGFWFLFPALVYSAGLAAPCFASEPEQVIDELHKLLTVESVTEAQQSPCLRYQTIRSGVLESHDFETISRIVAGGFWRTLSSSEQQHLIDAMATLSAATYAARFTADSELTFTPGIRASADKKEPSQSAKVSSQLIRQTGKPYNFEYLLRQKQNQWKIVNIMVDGVSDLALRRAELNRIFGESGYQGVMNHLTTLTREQMGEAVCTALAT